MKIRLGIFAIACSVAAGLWTGLESGAGLDLGESALAGVGLLAALAALLPLLSDGSSPSAQNASPAQEDSTLKGVTPAFAGRDNEWADIKDMVPRRRRKETRVAVMIHGMPGVGKSEFAVYAAHKLVDELSRGARRGHPDILARQVELHGLEGVAPTDPSDALRRLLDPHRLNQRLAKMDLGELSEAMLTATWQERSRVSAMNVPLRTTFSRRASAMRTSGIGSVRSMSWSGRARFSGSGTAGRPCGH